MALFSENEYNQQVSCNKTTILIMTGQTYTVGQELKFNIWNNIVVGKFQSIDGDLIKIEIVSDDYNISEPGEITTINKTHLAK